MMKATFNGDVFKIMKGAMVMAHGKKEGALYTMSSSEASVSVASSDLDVRVLHQDLGI